MANKYTELNTEFNILIVHMQLLSEICHFHRHINLKLYTINKGILYEFKDLTGGNRYLHCTSLYYFKLPVRSIMVACITLLQQYCTYYNATIKIIIHTSLFLHCTKSTLETLCYLSPVTFVINIIGINIRNFFSICRTCKSEIFLPS